MSSKFDWMSTPQYLAQVGHFFGALSFILIATLFSFLSGAGWPPILITFGFGVALSSFKEFVFDTSSRGEGDSWADSFMDWSFYMLGGGVGMGLAWLAHHLTS
jgi:hypothetical protein